MTTELSKFEEFNLSEWRAWLGKCVRGEPYYPLIPFAEPVTHIALGDLYAGLSELTKDLFSRAVVEVFEEVSPGPSNCEALFILIQLLAIMNPRDTKDVIRERLANPALEGLEFSGHNLVDLLISASGEKEVIDQDLVDLLRRRFGRSESLSRLLNCMRVSSYRRDRSYLWFLQGAIPMAGTAADAEFVARALSPCLGRTGHMHLFRWLRTELAQAGDFIGAALAAGPLQWPTAASVQSPYHVLASAVVNAGRRRFLAADLFLIATQLHWADIESVSWVLALVHARWLKDFNSILSTAFRVFELRDVPEEHMPIIGTQFAEMFAVQTREGDSEYYPVATAQEELQLLRAIQRSGGRSSPLGSSFLEPGNWNYPTLITFVQPLNAY